MGTYSTLRPRSSSFLALDTIPTLVKEAGMRKIFVFGRVLNWHRWKGGGDVQSLCFHHVVHWHGQKGGGDAHGTCFHPVVCWHVQKGGGGDA
ncbi:hypothetical protein AMTR_s00124p00048030 [Amborella trichopoda]|uniref:Uncharacterized protein n=1 Tax=Amborella trichopoda TaxID=13333 RepID=W1NRS9_AMBTC|nr:hypothetical protein AMTR_s00124p00048030 [Amborella trichopoda]